jgi:hypothetical protein
MSTTIQNHPDVRRTAVAALWTGMVLTVLATAAPWIDRMTTGILAGHIRAGYPAYDPASIDAAALAYLVILSITGVLGIAGWIVTIVAARAGRRWARWLATSLLAVGALVSVSGLTITDTSGDVGLAPAIAWLQVLPCTAGLIAVVLLWRRR